MFPEAYRRFLPPVRAKCRRMLGDGTVVEDVVQETFVRLWRAGPALDRTAAGAITQWLYRTSTRLAIDAIRERRRAADLDPIVLPCAAPQGALEARAAIYALCTHVPGDQLEAALLVRVDGLSQQEAATVMGVSERTVRRLLSRFDARTAQLREEVAS